MAQISGRSEQRGRSYSMASSNCQGKVKNYFAEFSPDVAISHQVESNDVRILIF